jgi:hypothetical protein
MVYRVIKGFYKLSESKTYNIGDVIELSDVEAKEMAKGGLVELSKEVKKAKKDD